METETPKPRWELHHNDGCTARIIDLYCIKCNFAPDMQSTTLWFFCTKCNSQMKTTESKCSNCGKKHLID